MVTSLLFRNVTTTYNIAVIGHSDLSYIILLYELQEHNCLCELGLPVYLVGKNVFEMKAVKI